ncbi:MAG: type VI secretion system ATPase TssH [Planctomycetes bacterium]|nr:type VI secretion system ATPase TssH [Planctomycetota bacterium]
MATLNLKALVSRLNDTTRRALEGAAGLCLSKTHHHVEIEHWLWKLMEVRGGDLEAIFRRFEVDPARLSADLQRSFEKMRGGSSRPPSLAENVVELARSGWLAASLEFEAPRTRSGHLLWALLADDALARFAHGLSVQFESIAPDALKREFAAITAKSSEAEAEVAAGGGSGPGGERPRAGGGSGALEQFTIDLTERARKGELDPVLGRDGEIRQVIDILTRRRQNNPIVTGEPGVGKTAIAEGFAQKIVQGDVPPALKDVAVRTLDLALLQAGAGVKGEFENRLKNVIQEVKSSPKPIILFIDEAHTLIGAGGSAGQGDAANLLKPALARGELRTIAATTWAEYKKYFERDAALARRFQVVKVEEPDEKTAIEIMRGLVATMEKHHGVRILDDAVVESVRLSTRYLSGRQLPDKSVSLLDTACARVALSQSATPAALDECRRQLAQLRTTETALAREEAATGGQAERLEECKKAQAAVQQEQERLAERWKREKELVAKVLALRGKVEQVAPSSAALKAGATAPAAPPPLAPEARAAARKELDAVTAELKALQGAAPLVHACVEAQAIAEVVENWTGIPAGRMLADQIRTVLKLRETLESRVVGQGHALEALSQAIRTSRANLTDPNRPIGVFLLVGTSGVGKTETAIALAELLYGGDQNLTVINMSEFKEEHKVSLLMGSPPGYVGYGEGGVLTEAVRRKPYSVVLLDELEKAHPGFQDVFYQVFDKGNMRDGEGRDIDFRNTVIVMTTNAGTDAIMSLCADPATMPDAEGLREALRPELLKTFKPAFLGRCTVLPYFPLNDSVMKDIIRLKLGKVRRRVQENYRARFDWSDELVDAIAARCTEVESGARNVDHILTRTLLPEMAAEFLAQMADGKAIRSCRATTGADGRFRYEIAADGGAAS